MIHGSWDVNSDILTVTCTLLMISAAILASIFRAFWRTNHFRFEIMMDRRFFDTLSLAPSSCILCWVFPLSICWGFTFLLAGTVLVVMTGFQLLGPPGKTAVAGEMWTPIYIYIYTYTYIYICINILGLWPSWHWRGSSPPPWDRRSVFQILQFWADLLPSVCPLNLHPKIRLFKNPLLDARCFFFNDFRWPFGIRFFIKLHDPAEPSKLKQA